MVVSRILYEKRYHKGEEKLELDATAIMLPGCEKAGLGHTHLVEYIASCIFKLGFLLWQQVQLLQQGLRSLVEGSDYGGRMVSLCATISSPTVQSDSEFYDPVELAA